MPTGLAGVRVHECGSLEHSGTSYIKSVSGCIKDRRHAGQARGEGGGGEEEEVGHAENQDEQENLLRLFSWSFPFSLHSNFHSETRSVCGL